MLILAIKYYADVDDTNVFRDGDYVQTKKDV